MRERTEEQQPGSLAWHYSVLLGHYFIIEALAALDEVGAWEKLRKGKALRIAELANELHCDERMLKELFDFLWITTALIDKNGDESYSLSPVGTAEWTDWMVTMTGAYRPVTSHMAGLLDGTVVYGRDVARNGAKLQRASFYLTGGAVPLVTAMLSERAINMVIDLGCGSADFLIRYCASNKRWKGMGIDIDHDAVTAARKNISLARMENQISVIQGDLRDARSIAAAIQDKSQVALIAIGVLHELLREGEGAVIELLTSLKKSFPGNTLIVGEYNAFTKNELRALRDEPKRLFYSFFQLLHPFSSQGDPQPRPAWEAMFAKSGLALESAKQLPGRRLILYTLAL